MDVTDVAYPISFQVIVVDNEAGTSSTLNVDIYAIQSFDNSLEQAFVYNIPVPDEQQSLIQSLGGVVEKYTFTFLTQFSDAEAFLTYIRSLRNLVKYTGTSTTTTISVPYIDEENQSCMVTKINYNFNKGEVYVVSGNCEVIVGKNILTVE
jgi:hypothetical protein